ncbi:hypothetical protein [Halodurantibacterium flavum]|uniref:Uncharacterized protein n=1 Tax=Halodurantibacterium flavum TaxID=1382802 RepID=A0ABW4S963_9RHOB
MSADYRVRPLLLGWGVIKAGIRVSPVFKTRGEAEGWLERHLAGRAPASRSCMSCAAPFDSAGLHDRLCPRCGLAGHNLHSDASATAWPGRHERRETV